MNNYLFISFIISFVITTFTLIITIPFLRKLKFGQKIRLEGPSNHLIKDGTPTMGGIVILIGFSLSFIINSVLYLNFNILSILKYLLPCYLYLLIGLVDDLLIVYKNNNTGITPKIKIGLQVLGLIIYYFVFLGNQNTVISLFDLKIDLDKLYFLFILLIFLSTTNAVNLTDGLDGLASGLLIISFIGTTLLGLIKENYAIVLLSVCLIASLLSFLIFNFNPAKIFMGNCGSLMFGSLLATIMVLLEEEMLLLILGFVFIIETLSVIIQVSYYKITKGKRIFLMAPIHHHYEKKGMSEVLIDLFFWVISIISLIILIIIII